MDLATLIVTAKGDRSYEQLVQDSGGATPSRARWQQLATQPLRNFPDPPTIVAIAGALGVSERVVVLAAATSLGLGVVDDDATLALLLPPSAAGLTERQVAAVLAVVRAMVEPEGTTTKTADEVSARITRIDRRRQAAPSEKRAARQPKDGPPQPIS